MMLSAFSLQKTKIKAKKKRKQEKKTLQVHQKDKQQRPCHFDGQQFY